MTATTEIDATLDTLLARAKERVFEAGAWREADEELDREVQTLERAADNWTARLTADQTPSQAGRAAANVGRYRRAAATVRVLAIEAKSETLERYGGVAVEWLAWEKMRAGEAGLDEALDMLRREALDLTEDL